MSLKSRFSAFGGRKVRQTDPPAEQQLPEAGATLGAGRPRLVVGLGNPGAEYGNTRHNVGAWTVNLLAKRHGVPLKRHGKIDRASITIDGHEVVIARPRAYMNVSGPPIAAEAKRLNLSAESLMVIYDELDLPVGRLRLRRAGSHGGNNGMKSLIDALGSRDFARARIGIDRPYEDGKGVRDPEKIADWVLAQPSPDELRLLDAAVTRAADAMELAIRDGLDAAMGRFNRSEGESAGGTSKTLPDEAR
jgi:PTH1 family peptidyl-tRNA hydrolase